MSLPAGSRAAQRTLGAHALDLLALAGDVDLDRVLDKVMRSARSLVGARFAALGVPDNHGGFARFITAGISERRAAQIGDLPRVHGVLGVLLEEPRTIVLADIRAHPRFGWFPGHHPQMTDFLGAPIMHRGEVLGNLFLSGARAGRFSAADRHTVETLAAYAGVAIANARLYERAQELAVIQERTRIAQELHDAVSQTLFSMKYEAHAGARRAEAARGGTAIAGAAETLRRLEAQATSSLAEMRNLVHALAPKSLERDGLVTTIVDLVAALGRSHEADIRVHASSQPLPAVGLDAEHALLRIAQEALHNALKHGAGAPVTVTLGTARGRLRLSVADTGPGFDEGRLSRTLRTMGLRSMRERAAEIGASLELRSAPGRGCTVVVRCPAARRPR